MSHLVLIKKNIFTPVIFSENAAFFFFSRTCLAETNFRDIFSSDVTKKKKKHQAKAIHVFQRECVYVCVLFLDESIDVVLCSVLVVGHLEHTRHTQQRFLSVSVAHHLETHTRE